MHTTDTNIINENCNRLQRSVVLVGLMGAGKSAIGRRLAQALGVKFVDSDNEIAEAAKCSIADIFEIYGENKFRDLEQRVIMRLIMEEPCIIATGGGAFVNDATRHAILENTTAIWLKASIDVLVARVSKRENRPLLAQGDKREILLRLMQQRDPLYAEAHITLENNSSYHEKTVIDIIDILRQQQILVTQ